MKEWTNKHQMRARLVDIHGAECISAFEALCLVKIPSSSPTGPLTQPLYRKTLETILNVAFGVSRRKYRPWGLLVNQIDRQAHEHQISIDIANNLRWRVFGDLVTWSENQARFTCSRKPSADDPYWQTQLELFTDEVRTLQAVDGFHYTTSSIIQIVNNATWMADRKALGFLRPPAKYELLIISKYVSFNHQGFFC